MAETSASLLERLRLQPVAADWQRLIDIYTPLIRGWLRRHATLEQDADDLVQEVLAVVVRQMPEFRREPRTGAFRRWLRSITVNCLRDAWRAQKLRPRSTGADNWDQLFNQLEDPNSNLSLQWDQEHDTHVLKQLLTAIKPHCEPATWTAFQRTALEGAPAELVAGELGMTVNAVFIAKSRVLARLRQEGDGLLE